MAYYLTREEPGTRPSHQGVYPSQRLHTCVQLDGKIPWERYPLSHGKADHRTLADYTQANSCRYLLSSFPALLNSLDILLINSEQVGSTSGMKRENKTENTAYQYMYPMIPYVA
ncbi:hypothetical protein VTK73DRAFT_365 [Phialemonium thermophilum]|uniref:Uncharacterized protein n=1 Tax=Phialemonium thermophilum TaxID=223376 RepID=A0ABR3XFD3_9PEZI